MSNNWQNQLSTYLAQLPSGLPIDRWAAHLGSRPCENLLAMIGLATVGFYQAERRSNPKVCDIWDSLVYCSTCVSVGYGDIFAQTPTGKIIGSALMTIGPSMAARALEGPGAEQPAAVQQQVLATLQEILAELRSKKVGSEAAAD